MAVVSAELQHHKCERTALTIEHLPRHSPPVTVNHHASTEVKTTFSLTNVKVQETEEARSCFKEKEDVVEFRTQELTWVNQDFSRQHSLFRRLWRTLTKLNLLVKSQGQGPG